MSFLAPLYALGALAIALPILFHLIQRRPRGQLLFGSLMFLSPSVPRITRRSRLSHWLLLLLRATALLFLALAFSRPFLTALGQLTSRAPERRVVILLDRSASMRRSTLWDQALKQARDVVDGCSISDRIGLFSFDDHLDVHVGLADDGVGTAVGAKLVVQKLGQLKPGWGATDLGAALTEAAQVLHGESANALNGEHLVVLISDLQEGSRVESLQATTWPPDVAVEVRQVETEPGNATVRLLPPDEDTDETKLRVRVSHFGEAKTDTFQLAWQNDAADRSSLSVKTIQIAPGRSRVVTVPRRGARNRLVLRGDGHEFDNVAFLAPIQVDPKRLLFVGHDEDQTDRQLFYLKRTSLGTAQHPVHVESYGDTTTPPTDINVLNTPLIVVARPLAEAWWRLLRRYLTQGGRVLIVMDPGEFAADATDTNTNTNTNMITSLMDLETCNAEVVKADEYAIISDVEFQNPVFQPFADIRFNDFTKIRFWQYYRLTAAHEQPWSVLARFDDNTPALVEKAFGPGRLWVLATGWSPDTSQLALSTKFVPLLVNLLGPSIDSKESDRGLVVGQAIDLSTRPPFVQVVDPIGRTLELAEGVRQYDATDRIGIYRFGSSDQAWEVAVNLDPSESRTTPLDIAELQRRGVRLGEYESNELLGQRDRQMRDVELESYQKLWRWLLVIALSLLAVETYVAGRTSQRSLAVMDVIK